MFVANILQELQRVQSGLIPKQYKPIIWDPRAFASDGPFVEMNMTTRFLLLPRSWSCFGASAAGAEAVRFDVEVREDVLGGRSRGLAGAYERLVGWVRFEVNPQNSANRVIREIDYASLNAVRPS